jgi:hypothetical protein
MAALRYEWRRKHEGDDALIAIDVMDDKVVRVWPADPTVLTAFLNDLAGLDPRGRNGLDQTQRSPAYWGDLVLSRGDEGDVLYIDPQMYWEGVQFWFRSRGLDPHTTHRRG